MAQGTIRKKIVIFFLLNLLLSSLYLDNGQNWNSISRILPIMAWNEQGNFCIDKYKDQTGDLSYIKGHYYTDKAPLATLIVFPFYQSAVMSGIIHRNNNFDDLFPIGYLASLLTGSLPFVILVCLIYAVLLRRGEKLAALWAMLPVYGSMLFVFSGAFFGHLLCGIWLVLAYICLKKQKYFIAGFLSGLAFSSEFPSGIFILFWFVLIMINQKSLKEPLKFALGTLPGILFILMYNAIFTGSPWMMLYSFEAQAGFANEFTQSGTWFGFGIPKAQNIWEMIFGQYKGLLFYTPFLALFFLQIFKHFSFKWKHVFSHYLFLPTLAFTMLIVSKNVSWWGGWTYGPRYLIPVCMLWFYLGIPYLVRIKTAPLLLLLFSGFGLISAWMAKVTVGFTIPTEENIPVLGYVKKNFLLGNYNPHHLFHGLGLSPAIMAWAWLVCFVLVLFYLDFFPLKKSRRWADLS